MRPSTPFDSVPTTGSPPASTCSTAATIAGLTPGMASSSRMPTCSDRIVPMRSTAPVHAHDPQLTVVEHHPQRSGIEHRCEHARIAVRLVDRDGADHGDDHPLPGKLDPVDVELCQTRPLRRLEHPLLAVAAAALREAVDQPVEAGAIADPDIGGRPAEYLLARQADELAEPVAHLDHHRVTRTGDCHGLHRLGEIARERSRRRS